MKSPLEWATENFYDPPTNPFYNMATAAKSLDLRLDGLFRQRTDACNLKIRFVAVSYLEVTAIINELEHGEFIYFDEQSRLKSLFYLEAFVIFARTVIDLAVSAYSIYFGATTDIDSINDFFKKVKREEAWIPNVSRKYWSNLAKLRDEEELTWIRPLVGATNGDSALRDLIIHKSTVWFETTINERNKGKFYMEVGKQQVEDVIPFLDMVFFGLQELVCKVVDDITDAEQTLKGRADQRAD